MIKIASDGIDRKLTYPLVCLFIYYFIFLLLFFKTLFLKSDLALFYNIALYCIVLYRLLMFIIVIMLSFFIQEKKKIYIRTSYEVKDDY